MNLLISLALASLLIFVGGGALRKYSTAFYLAAAAASCAVIACTFAGVRFGGVMNAWIWPLFARGGLAGALFIYVMWAGALPNGSALIKKLMPLRAELSILACILTLGHNIAYGKTYFVINVINFTKRVYQTQLLFLCCSVAAYSASWSLDGAICNTVNEHADF